MWAITTEARSGHEVEASVWVLGITPAYSGGTASALNHPQGIMFFKA